LPKRAEAGVNPALPQSKNASGTGNKEAESHLPLNYSLKEPSLIVG